MQNMPLVPIQIFVVCSTTGQLTPLRFRYEDPLHEIHTVNISEVVDTKESSYGGKPEITYTCKAAFGNVQKLFFLKYSVEGHKWYFVGMLEQERRKTKYADK